MPFVAGGSACALVERRTVNAVQVQTMRFLSILAPWVAFGTMSVLAATPEAAPSPTVPPAAAEQGKDVVHALNNAFAKVFEIVAPSVVIIEVSKKNDGPENSAFDDL